MIIKRLFDIVLALICIIIFLPLFIFISILIIIDSNFPVIYTSNRVGRQGKIFKFYKFRTMFPDSEYNPITIGNCDPRITRVGRFLRKYKFDELPQLFNVLIGNMSFVGPRPDVPKYKEHYIKLFKDYYKIKPGITGYASLYFVNEAELYKNVPDPEKIYILKIIPEKVKLDKKYYKEMSLLTDIKIIFQTFLRVFANRK